MEQQPIAQQPQQQQALASSKVVVFYKSAGNAPRLVQKMFKIDGSEKFAKVVNFLRKQVQLEDLFLYINEAFVPSQDELVGDLYTNFGVDGKLVVNYATTPAWG